VEEESVDYMSTDANAKINHEKSITRVKVPPGGVIEALNV
jgi:hypothetical protein